MSTENDSAPAAPADPAEMPQEVTAPVIEDHDAAPAEAGDVTAPAPASPETASAPEAEGVVEATPEPAAPGAEETATPGAEEATAAAPAKTELSPAQCAARLAELFPALFGTQGPPKPIKLRIQADIQQRAPGLFTRKALSIVLHRHTTSTPYLKALVAAPSRFDLDGEPTGEIAEEHRLAAREEVERRRAIVAARRAAEGQTRNPREPRGPRPHRSPAGGGTPGEGTTTANDLTGAPEPGMQPGIPPVQQPDAARPHAQPRRDRGHRDGTGSPGRRPPRGPQQFHEAQGGREPHVLGEPREPRPPRSAGPAADRPRRHGADQASAPHRDGRPPRQNTRQETHRETRFEAPRDATRPRPLPEAQAHAALPEDPARRERALLLRTYEASSLTKSNFCVLKRITEAELDAQLALARQERGPARPRP